MGALCGLRRHHGDRTVGGTAPGLHRHRRLRGRPGPSGRPHQPQLAPAVRLGTRGSPLALTQAEIVRRAYLDRFPDETVEVVVIKTAGDLDTERPLDAFGGAGAFVTEIETALLDNRVDAAVHSAKDLAIEDAEGLQLVAFLEREDAHDVLVRR